MCVTAALGDGATLLGTMGRGASRPPQSRDSAAAFKPTVRRPGTTVIHVCPRGLGEGARLRPLRGSSSPFGSRRSSRPSFAYAIWLISRVMNVDAKITEETHRNDDQRPATDEGE